MHLKTEEFVDIVEGTRAEASAPHLAACASCRAQLLELRTILSAARDVDVPDPSPLFWDHLSSRVRDAVATEAVDARLKTWGSVFGARAFQASAAVALLFAVVLGSRLMAPPPAATGSPFAAAPPPATVIADANASTDVLWDAASDDTSLMLVASLTSALALDAASAAGLAPSGSAEHAVTHMSEGELRELGRLLKEELARSGA